MAANRTSLEKAELQAIESRHDDVALSRPDTVALESDAELESEGGGVPPGYWYSYQFLGSAAAIILLANNLFIGYAMPANVLTVINADIGPDPQIYLVSLVNTLIKGVLLLIVGSLSDVLGRRYFIMAGQAFGVVGSFVCATATSINVLIGANVLIGISGAVQVLFPLLVSELVPNKYRGAFQAGIIGCVFPSLGLGPAFARMMVEYTGPRWRTLFYVNGAACGISLILFGLCYFPPDFQQLHKSSAISKREQLKRIDFGGLILYSGGLVGILLALSWGGKQYAWNSAPVIACLVIGCVTLIAFGFYEAYMKLHTPLLPIELFKIRNFWLAVIVGSIGQMSYYALNVLWPQHITQLYTTDNLTVGWMSCTQGAALVFGEALFGPICKKGWNIKLQMIIAACGLTLFCGLMAYANEYRQGYAIAITILLGTFVGWIELICIVLASLVVPPENIGSGQAFFASTRALAGTIATSIYLAIFTNRTGALIPANVGPAAIAAGFPESNIATLLAAVSKGTAAAIAAVPDVTPAVRAAIAAATKTAYSNSISTVYLTSVVFGVAAIVCCFFITKDYDRHFTNFVNKTVSARPPPPSKGEKITTEVV